MNAISNLSIADERSRWSACGTLGEMSVESPVCARGDRRAPILDCVLKLMSYSPPRGGLSPGPQFGNATPEVAFNGLGSSGATPTAKPNPCKKCRQHGDRWFVR